MVRTTPITTWANLVGRRILVKKRFAYFSDSTEEYKLLEISPSCSLLKLEPPNGDSFWADVLDYKLVEVLDD